MEEIQIVAIIQYQILSKYNTTAEPMTTQLTGHQAPVCSKYQKHLTPHGHATWSRHMMMQYDNTGCCPIPEPQFLIYARVVQFNLDMPFTNLCEKLVGLKPYTLKLAQVCVRNL